MIKQRQCQRSMGSTSNDLSAAIQQMLEAVAQNDDLKRSLRMATTASAVSEVAAQAGVPIEPAALVKHYAQRLLEASDATAIHNFDLCSWDAGELLWTMKNWRVQD
jgi:predicted metallo-beta-lactamase superfamily hydrolase